MYITEIDCDIEGDTFFPKFVEENFVKEIHEKLQRGCVDAESRLKKK